MGKLKKRAISIVILISISVSLNLSMKSNIVLATNNTESAQEILFKALEKNTVNNSNSFSGIDKIEINKENSELMENKNPEEKVRVIVELNEKPATLSTDEEVTEDMIEKVKEDQKPIQDAVENETGEEVRHTYGNLINGFSIEVKRKDIEKIESIDGVNKVTEAKVYYPDMSSAKEFSEATEVWKDYGYKGEGLVVSIIDTGIDYTHKDMKISDPTKAKLSKENINEEVGKYYTEKVPYGYNFADDDDEIIDLSGSMHGMHVAGIVAANASEEEVKNNKGIEGVAPEAQLLAMKVFSNNSDIKGAYSDDIIAAIEKSVDLHADVINMSLGSTAGYRDDEDPEQVAIKNATDDGVICVISAGNSDASTSPYMIDGVSDISTIGSPGIAKDALQVASSENSQIVLSAFTLNINGETKNIGYTRCDIDPSDKFALNQDLNLVDCGLGRIEDFNGKDLTGKIALVKRGSITFVEKQINAQNAGASAVIIYNSSNAGYINMATDSSIEIPAMFINGDDGVLIKNNIEKASVEFNKEIVNVPNLLASQMSEFTSWGPTPDLEFAPQITAPGGNIYSTLNNNKYGSMSGTSMAAPHVSGATALIIQGLKDKDINLTGRELVEFVKKSIINTAEPLIEETLVGEKIPYSPRRQGSGMIQAKSAIDNRVIAVGENNEATISLKEIGDTTNFKITLKNYSSKEEKYKIESLGDVLTAIEPSMFEETYIQTIPFDTTLEGATLDFDKEEITVPANGEAYVNVVLNIPSDAVSNNFVEGFIRFISEDKETPKLVVPYMGYYGDWSEESIIDKQAWESSEVKISPSFATAELLGNYNYLGYSGTDSNGSIIIDPEKIAISPNDDYLYDTIVPALYLLRNAKEVKVDLLDKDKNLIQANVNGDKDLRKKILSSTGGENAEIYSSLSWNGKIYDKSLGEEVAAPEGQYYLNYKARVDGTDSYQDYLMPVKIDVTPISSKLESSKESDDTDYNLEVSFNNEMNNIISIVLAVNDEIITDYTEKDDLLSANLKLNDNSINKVQILTIDNAGNLGMDTYEIGVGEYKPEVKLIDFEEGQSVNNNELIINGKYSGDIKELLINNEAPDYMEDGVFYKILTLKEGYNLIKIHATDSNGEVVANETHKVFCDTVAPEIEIYEPLINDNQTIITAQDSIKLKGAVSDNTIGYKFFINGENKLNLELDGSKGKEDTYREFEYEIPVENNDIITLKAIDLLGNETIKKINVVVDKTIPEINIDGVENNKYYNTSVVPKVTTLDKDTKITALLNGVDYNFEEIKDEGSYELEVKANGINGVENIKKIYFVIDKTAPIINIEGLLDKVITNLDLCPKITTDNDSTLYLELNGEIYNGESITKEGKYLLKIKSIDKANNTTTKEISFEIDKTAPVISIDGIIDGMKYDTEVVPEIKNSENANLKITLNDKDYNGEAIKADGEYVIKVVAKDLAGNITEVTKKFTIKLPEANINKPNPTPTPEVKPGENEGKLPSSNDETIEPNDSEKDKTSENNIIKENEKTDLPKTGNESVYYLLISAIVLISVGGIIIRRKKVKNN